MASFVGGWLLKAIAFDATLAIQTQSTMDNLLLLRCLFPIAAYAITLVAMRFYPIDKQGEADLQVALDKLEGAGVCRSRPELIFFLLRPRAVRGDFFAQGVKTARRRGILFPDTVAEKYAKPAVWQPAQNAY